MGLTARVNNGRVDSETSDSVIKNDVKMSWQSIC